MKILIIGSGAVGIGLGSSMLSQNTEVSFLASKNTEQEMRENGIKRTGLFTHYSFNPDEFDVYENYCEIPKGEFDYIFVTSKTTANKDIALNLSKNKDILNENTKIIIFQNGFGNDEFFLKYFTQKQVYCARVITGFSRPERYISEVTVYTEPILLGSLQNEDISFLSEIADKITLSGIKCELSKDLDKYLWAKMLYNCALNPLGAILNMTYGELSQNTFTRELMDKIIDEIFEVINASPYSTLWQSPEEYREIFYNKLVPDTFNHYSSTHQDIQRKIPTEIDTLNGKVIDLGKKYNIATPVNKTIYNLIKSIESKF